MKLPWGRKQPVARKRNEYNWELIGSLSYDVKSEHFNVPSWVLKAYNKTRVHHDGVVYRFNGKQYQYKVEESGQGACFNTFYRRCIRRNTTQK